MVAIVAFTDQFEARHAVAEVKPFDHAQFLEQVHGPINRHEVAKSFWQGRENLLVGERMTVLAKDFQDGLARLGILGALLNSLVVPPLYAIVYVLDGWVERIEAHARA